MACARAGGAALCRGTARALLNRSWLHTAPSAFAKSAEEKLGLDKPKRPMTPFLKFATQMRPALQAKNPGTDTLSVMKLASKHWHQLDANVKSKIVKEYEKDMEDYKKIKSVYDSSLTDAQKEDIKRVKEEIATAKEKRRVKAEYKELGRPKRPMSSYMLFCQTEKEQIKDIGLTDFQKKMKVKWAAMSTDEKAKYEKNAAALMLQYRKEMQVWEQKMIEMGHIEYVRTRKLPASVEKKPKLKETKDVLK